MYRAYSGRRVAFLHHQLALGGSERVSYDAACYLHSFGIESHFFASTFDERKWLESGAKHFPVHILPKRGKNHCFTSPNIDILIETIRRERIEVLFVAVPDKGLPTRLKGETGCRVVLWLHSLPYFEAMTKIESYRTQGERSWYNYLMWHLVHKPRLLWQDSLMRKWQARYREKIRSYDAMIVLVEDYREQMIKELSLGGEEAKKIFVKTNTIRIEPKPILNKEKQIIYMGRLSRSDKRIDRLLRIWSKASKQLPDWELIIYGSATGKEGKYLQSLADKLSLERCRFAGFVANPKTAYDTASVLCMTSSYEGWPLALIEAQNQGVIPIAFDSSPGIHSILGGDAGVLVEPFDLDAYSNALVSLCQDTEQMRTMQKRVLEKRYDYDTDTCNAKEWEALRPILFPED